MKTLIWDHFINYNLSFSQGLIVTVFCIIIIIIIVHFDASGRKKDLVVQFAQLFGFTRELEQNITNVNGFEISLILKD